MISFPDSVLELIHALQESYSKGKNCLIISYPILEVIKEENEREVSTKFFFDYKTGTFEIQPPTYRYFSKISHFDFKKPERRWSRNKNYLFPLIGKLKDSGLWDLVSNKDFLVVNEHNDKIDQKKLNSVLEKI